MTLDTGFTQRRRYRRERGRLNQMWQCPDCNRMFQNANQSHSCKPSVSIEEIFTGKKAEWFALYKQFQDAFDSEGLPFDVHCSKTTVYWRHDSAFAAFIPKVKHLEMEFCRDGYDPHVPAIRHMEMSPHRVSHYIAVTDDSELVRTTGWIRESYLMTRKN